MGSETSDTSESTQTESNNASEPKSESTNASQTKQESVNKTTEKTEGQKEEKRPCCVCKETRAARDLCYAEKGFEECYKEIQQHKDCMASEGFKI
eukprot:CAMPEP_0201582506 /NCGR_PEP_ID=MMETSP0190_2-20130828/86361_1 /ASSEMBLY_ACC=CAM_ASM_000263 /TAXON_ID=37353 /ORGANISM="Rosalina sp." /LENGTH=94 /DNA_ID=CAMNT_0048022569 /DNA_START=26 /DNA_END=310 /DNA_ORIENTATION=+